MKYTIIILIFLFSTGYLAAQNAVGIGTENPQGIFHVNAQNESVTTDDVIVNSEGNVGIGKVTGVSEKLDVSGNTLVVGDQSIGGNTSVTNHIRTNQLKFYNTPLSTPKAKLDIEASAPRTGLRLKNTSEATSPSNDTRRHIPVLSTDDNNNLYWQNLPNAVSNPIVGEIKTGTVLSVADDDKYVELTTSSGRITLNEGYWLISAKCVIGTGSGSGTTSGTTSGIDQIASIFLCMGEPSLTNTANAITGTGVIGETASYSAGICILQFSYLYRVPAGATKTLALYLRSDYLSKAYSLYSTGDWKEPYFNAVRLDQAN